MLGEVRGLQFGVLRMAPLEKNCLLHTSKPAIVSMASKLAGPVEPFKMDDPEVMVEVEVENSEEMDVKSQLQEMVMVVMEEDQEMLAMAGIKLQPQQQMDPLIV